MLHNAFGGKTNSLLSEYASTVGDAILRHRTRLAEKSARVETELAGRVKSEFLANMSHELRTPLNTVIGFSKILGEHQQRHLTDAEIVDYSMLIHNAAGHLLAVINDILDLSKLQSGRYTIDSRECDLDEIVLRALKSHEAAAVQAKVQLSHRIQSKGLKVRGDEKKLLQIFANIISNAIKFTPEKGKVSVDAIRVPDGTAVVVRDTGIGMSEEEIEVALTPFGQVDGARTRWREGTGLGLSIARSLAELHGGSLQIRSAKGIGTEITVKLPRPTSVTVTSGIDTLTDRIID